jgi:hypothetical protein
MGHDIAHSHERVTIDSATHPARERYAVDATHRLSIDLPTIDQQARGRAGHVQRDLCVRLEFDVDLIVAAHH